MGDIMLAFWQEYYDVEIWEARVYPEREFVAECDDDVECMKMKKLLREVWDYENSYQNNKVQ